jgi:hypothetical protein
VAQATPEQKQAAQEKYDEAMKAFQAKRFDEALAGFRASYEIVASPNTRLMVANTLQASGDVVAAYWEAQATVEVAEEAEAHDERYAAAADSARKALARLRAEVGLVTVKVVRATGGQASGPLELTVAGKAIEEADWGKTVAVAPGQCEVVLTSPTGSARKEIAVSAGATIDITVGPPVAGATGRAAEPDGPDAAAGSASAGGTGDGTALLISGGVIGALGVAGAVVFAVFGSLAKSNYDSLLDQCPNDRCASDLESQADETRTQQTVANIGLVAGAVGLAAGVSLLVAGAVVGSSSSSGEGSSEEPAPDVSLALGPGALMLSGSF